MKTVKAKRKQMTQKDFDAIKTLLAAGLSASKVAQVLQRGNGTIWYVAKSETFADYQKIIKTINTKREPQIQEQQSLLPKEKVETNELIDRVVDTLNSHLHALYPLLERIAVALEEVNKPLTTNTVVEKKENASDEDLPIL